MSQNYDPLFGNPAQTTRFLSHLGAGGGSGSSAPTDITYAALVTAIAGATLTPGACYRLTDFATVHYICDPNGARHGINTGPTEVLLLHALTANSLCCEAASESYPQDRLTYDWNPANWADDCAFSDDAHAPVAGFTGVITSREDTRQSNWLGYDFRAVKMRRWKTDVPAWDANTTYTANACVTSAGFVYRSLKNDNLNQTPADEVAWFKLLDLSVSQYWNALSDAWLGLPSDPLDFQDVLTFQPGTGSATYENNVYSNYFAAFKDNQTYDNLTASLLPGDVFYLQPEDFFQVYSNRIGPEHAFNTVGGFFNHNTIGTAFYSNIIGGDFYSNDIGDGCSANICTLFSTNTIANLFSHNTVGRVFYNNTIGSSFQFNNISSGFNDNSVGSNCLANIIGSECRQNIIATGFQNNIIGNGFWNNTIGSAFAINTTADNFGANDVTHGVNNADFTRLSSAYAQTYTKTVSRAEDGSVKLSYLDASGVMQVVSGT